MIRSGAPGPAPMKCTVIRPPARILRGRHASRHSRGACRHRCVPRSISRVRLEPTSTTVSISTSAGSSFEFDYVRSLAGRGRDCGRAPPACRPAGAPAGCRGRREAACAGAARPGCRGRRRSRLRRRRAVAARSPARASAGRRARSRRSRGRERRAGAGGRRLQRRDAGATLIARRFQSARFSRSSSSKTSAARA